MTKTKDKNEQVRDAAARGLLRRMLDAIKGKDRKALDKLMDEMEEAEGDEASEKETMEATGTHIHLHLGGEQEAKGGDPSKAGAADEEEEPGEGEESPAAGADQNTEKRLLALESGQNQILEALRKIAARVGLSEEEESEDEEAGEEEAEGEVPESSDDAEGEEEEEKPKKEPKDKKGADKMGVSKMGLKSSDKKATKDSAGLKDEFTEVKSDAEVLAPGLKAPTFDAKAPAKTTQDSMCLLRRRALAAAMRDEKNGGKEAVQTVLGKKSLTGLDCASVEPVFNGAVALMRDRNMQDDKPTTISEARGGKKTADQAPVTSVADLNAQNRAHYKQSPAKQ